MPLTRQAKEQLLVVLQDQMSRAKAGIIADYSGLNVAASAEIRRAFREVGGEYRVIKDKLAKLVIKGTDRAALSPMFAGTTAIAFMYSEEFGKLGRTAQELAKKHKNFEVKGGFVGNDVINHPRALDVIAALPTLDEARAQLLGVINAPAAKLLAQLNAPASHVIGVLQAKIDKENEEKGA